jgi:hypothetical protein
VAGPQHRTPEYRRAYQALAIAQRAGQWLTCVEPNCVMSSRDIAPWMPAHVCHDPSGMVIIGVGHRRCNIAEVNERRTGAQRARRLIL